MFQLVVAKIYSFQRYSQATRAVTDQAEAFDEILREALGDLYKKRKGQNGDKGGGSKRKARDQRPVDDNDKMEEGAGVEGAGEERAGEEGVGEEGAGEEGAGAEYMEGVRAEYTDALTLTELSEVKKLNDRLKAENLSLRSTISKVRRSNTSPHPLLPHPPLTPPPSSSPPKTRPSSKRIQPYAIQTK